MQITSRWETRWFREKKREKRSLCSRTAAKECRRPAAARFRKRAAARLPVRARKNRARVSLSLSISLCLFGRLRRRESVDDATRVAGKRRLSGVRCWNGGKIISWRANKQRGCICIWKSRFKRRSMRSIGKFFSYVFPPGVKSVCVWFKIKRFSRFLPFFFFFFLLSVYARITCILDRDIVG